MTERREPVSLKTRQAAFILNWLKGGDHITCSTAFDEECDFMTEFEKLFPGRKPDPNLTRTASRLRKLMKEMSDDGYLKRWKLSNQCKYHSEDPSWQYAYAIHPDDLARMKEGRLCPDDLAIKWNGL